MAGKKLAFLGLGVMGYPMAGHLARAGHDATACEMSGTENTVVSIEFRCPACQQKYTAPDSSAGKVTRCKKCSATVTITITATSKPGEGSTFIIRMPLRQKQERPGAL